MRVKKVSADSVKLHDSTKVKFKTAGKHSSCAVCGWK